ncbi:hypothetical protein DESC_720096 [Desulfosarcina cetonica]|nr:hypothetical protein DESC_720096 [Desulfosarcina cetonica]
MVRSRVAAQGSRWPRSRDPSLYPGLRRGLHADGHEGPSGLLRALAGREDEDLEGEVQLTPSWVRMEQANPKEAPWQHGTER